MCEPQRVKSTKIHKLCTGFDRPLVRPPSEVGILHPERCPTALSGFLKIYNHLFVGHQTIFHIVLFHLHIYQAAIFGHQVGPFDAVRQVQMGSEIQLGTEYFGAQGAFKVVGLFVNSDSVGTSAYQARVGRVAEVAPNPAAFQFV